MSDYVGNRNVGFLMTRLIWQLPVGSYDIVDDQFVKRNNDRIHYNDAEDSN